MTGGLVRTSKKLCAVLCITVQAAAAQNADVLPSLVKLAEAGNAEAAYALALAYETGENISRDVAAAARMYGKAAESGHAPAQARLAYLYQTGAGVTRDPAKAFQLYGKAAQTDVEAQFQLALAHVNGIGTTTDSAAGRQWLAKAANADHQEAQLMLGLMMQQGLGGPKNEFSARRWMQRAAAGRNTEVASRAAKVQQQIESSLRAGEDSLGTMRMLVAVTLGLIAIGAASGGGAAGYQPNYNPLDYDYGRHVQRLRSEQECMFVSRSWQNYNDSRNITGGGGAMQYCR
jgi:hypothetical protein